MRGIVIHHKNGIRRAIEGKSGQGRLSVRPILAVISPPGQTVVRPVSFVFYENERVIAHSSRVLLKSGRRYPGVEHWFVLPETPRQVTTADPQHASTAP